MYVGRNLKDHLVQHPHFTNENIKVTLNIYARSNMKIVALLGVLASFPKKAGGIVGYSYETNV